MEVKLLETSVVSPSPPPFDRDHVLLLSHLDNDRNVQVTVRTLRAYANSDPSFKPAHAVTRALSKALHHYYPLAGTLRRRAEDQRLELLCAQGKGVRVVSVSADCSLSSAGYLDDPGSPFLEQLVPNPTGGEELLHPLVVQITVFACGGFSLGLCIHHSMCDGFGSTLFLSAVATYARGAGAPPVAPVWDRASLLGPRDPPRVEMASLRDHLKMVRGSCAYAEVGYRVARECFPVRDDCVERLKARLRDESGMSFTTFEAMGAFVWRAKVKAMDVPGEEKVKFAYSADMRTKAEPALPPGYWGNACVPVYLQATAKDLVERPIWEAAHLIRDSKASICNEYLRSFIDLQDLHSAGGITAGEWVSGFTDWRHLGHSGVDFGEGGPVTVLPLSWNLLGSAHPCFFLPQSGGRQGGFRLLLSLPQPAMPAFRKDMELFSSDAGFL